jgi:hypothetical protein
VGDGVAHPVDGDQIDLVELAQVVGPILVVRRIVGFAAVLEIADVVDRDVIAVDRGPGDLGDVALPTTVVRGLDPAPDEEKARGDEGEDDEE